MQNPRTIAVPATNLTYIANFQQQTVATPTMVPNGGMFTNSANVTLTCATSGATIRYTTDGTVPFTSSPVYNSPFAVTSTGTVKTKAFKAGYADSAVTSSSFTIVVPVNTVATPVIVPAGGTFTNSVTVTLTCVTTGATIRYTMDGTDPTASSPAYSSPFAIMSTGQIKAKAFKTSYAESGIAAANFTINAPPTPPTVRITVQAFPAIAAATLNGSGTCTVGSSQTISATAKTGWMFVGWEDGSLDNPRTVPVPASDQTFTADFQSALDYVKFTETYQDKIGCDASKNCGTYPTGTFTVNAVLFTGIGLAAASLNGDTPVAITIGNWSYQGVNNTLSDDPKYKPTVTRATLKLTYEDSTGKTNSAGTATLGFGKKSTTLTISTKAGQDAQGNDIQSFVDADTLTGIADPGKSVAVSDKISATITIGDYTESFTNIVITGTDAVKNSKGKDGNTYQLDTVKIKGSSQR